MFWLAASAVHLPLASCAIQTCAHAIMFNQKSCNPCEMRAHSMRSDMFLPCPAVRHDGSPGRGRTRCCYRPTTSAAFPDISFKLVRPRFRPSRNWAPSGPKDFQALPERCCLRLRRKRPRGKNLRRPDGLKNPGPSPSPSPNPPALPIAKQTQQKQQQQRQQQQGQHPHPPALPIAKHANLRVARSGSEQRSMRGPTSP